MVGRRQCNNSKYDEVPQDPEAHVGLCAFLGCGHLARTRIVVTKNAPRSATTSEDPPLPQRALVAQARPSARRGQGGAASSGW